MVVYLTFFITSTLKYNVKRECIFYLILVGIPSTLIMSIKNKQGGGSGFFLNGQNPISVIKAVCLQSLSYN